MSSHEGFRGEQGDVNTCMLHVLPPGPHFCTVTCILEILPIDGYFVSFLDHFKVEKLSKRTCFFNFCFVFIYKKM